MSRNVANSSSKRHLTDRQLATEENEEDSDRTVNTGVNEKNGARDNLRPIEQGEEPEIPVRDYRDAWTKKPRKLAAKGKRAKRLIARVESNANAAKTNRQTGAYPANVGARPPIISSHPTESIAFPVVAEGFSAGADGFPAGFGSFPAGADAYPEGADELPETATKKAPSQNINRLITNECDSHGSCKLRHIVEQMY